jgi:hypothetical protein
MIWLQIMRDFSEVVSFASLAVQNYLGKWIFPLIFVAIKQIKQLNYAS